MAKKTQIPYKVEITKQIETYLLHDGKYNVKLVIHCDTKTFEIQSMFMDKKFCFINQRDPQRTIAIAKLIAKATEQAAICLQLPLPNTTV